MHSPCKCSSLTSAHALYTEPKTRLLVSLARLQRERTSLPNRSRDAFTYRLLIIRWASIACWFLPRETLVRVSEFVYVCEYTCARKWGTRCASARKITLNDRAASFINSARSWSFDGAATLARVNPPWNVIERIGAIFFLGLFFRSIAALHLSCYYDVLKCFVLFANLR